jgi:murein L,D-transpeptidase YcbB/YkuD
VLALRHRLAVTDDAPLGGPDDALFDDALLQAVERAQARHGLVVDGVAGRNTLAALNRSVEDRIRDIQMNMERWRWLPRDLGRLHLFINVADFRLQVVNDGAVDLEMPVIVGRPYRRTPIFSNKLRYLEFNPTWTVPPRIAGRDLLPKIRKDPGFLAAQGFEVYSGWSAEAVTLDPASIDWQAVSPDRFPYKLKQRPGPTNAMGRVKFMLPNSYDIYLHDTPNHDLFDRTQRTFSSGCVRLSDPRALADYLLTFLPGWDMARLDAVWEGGNQTRVNLSETIPVHFAYFTVLADSTGRLAFRRDVYGRDTTLLEALRDQLVI